jgi:uncharacterized protein YdaU (DUF1376 family)
MANKPRAKFPHVPIWIDDFLGDTQHLDCLETGAYLLLLFAAWRTAECGLPDDDRQLSRMARVSPKTWTKLRPVVMAFWHLGTDSLWHQKRLDRVRREVADKYLKAVQAGQASALKRLHSGSTGVGSKFPTWDQRPDQHGANQPNLERYDSSLSENHTDAAREPAPDSEAPARAHPPPEPTPEPGTPPATALSPDARATRQRLADITAAKRAAFLKRFGS